MGFRVGSVLQHRVGPPGSSGVWWEYLDVTERALEEAAPLSEAAFSAALLLSRRNRALKARGAASTDG
jgi:hypothetical protein